MSVLDPGFLLPDLNFFPLIPFIDFGGATLGHKTSGFHQRTKILILALVKYVL